MQTFFRIFSYINPKLYYISWSQFNNFWVICISTNLDTVYISSIAAFGILNQELQVKKWDI